MHVVCAGFVMRLTKPLARPNSALKLLVFAAGPVLPSDFPASLDNARNRGKNRRRSEFT